MALKKKGTPEKIKIVKDSEVDRLLKDVKPFDGPINKEKKPKK